MFSQSTSNLELYNYHNLSKSAIPLKKKANFVILMTLAQAIQDSWIEIEKIYNAGKIPSERHLQAELFHILVSNEQFASRSQIFIEPNIYGASGNSKSYTLQGIIPDMLIVENQQVVCIIELKYCPSGYIQYEKDLTTFSKFYKLKEESFKMFLQTEPMNGDYKNLEYSINCDLLFAYSVIGQEDSDAIRPNSDIWRTYINQTFKNYLYLIGSVNNSTMSTFYTLLG